MKRHPLADCDNCPLNVPGTAFVPSKFAKDGDAELVVVGEAPGFYEAKRGEPFVGPSGKLLDKVLSHYGYKRDEVMYTNVCLCRPKADNARANVAPPKAAIAACRPRLLHELSVSGATDLLALGGPAASATINDGRTITSLRVGAPKEPQPAVREAGIARVVGTWHPAYCLRNGDAFPSMVSDVAKLKGSNRSAWSPPRWKYFDDVSSARAVIAELYANYSRIVVDIEVGIEKDISFGHPNEYDLLCVGLSYQSGSAVVIGSNALADEGVLADLRNLLRNVRVIAHNGKFDLAGLYPKLGPLELWFDTMLASYVLDERPGNHGLKVRAVEDLGAPQYDLEIRKYVPKKGNYANIPRELLYKYCAYDVACTWDLHEIFVERLEQESKGTEWEYDWLGLPPKTLRDVHDWLVHKSNQLVYLELNGITVDRNYQRELRGIFSQRIGKLEDDLNEIVCKPVTTEDPSLAELAPELSTAPLPTSEVGSFNPRSPKQVKEYLASQGLRVDSTNEDTLKRLLERLDPNSAAGRFCTTLLLHRRQQKLYSTYVDGIRKRLYRGRVYTTYLLHGTTSGRLASRNPNLQNIVRDKDIRRQFSVSKPENVLIQLDYKNAELRVIATLAQDEYLRTLLCDPKIDMFDTLSDQLYGSGNWRKEVERIRTKAFVYGIGYGREPYSIGLEYNIPPREAQELYDGFVSLIPATMAWQKQIKRKVHAGQDLVTPFGRRRRFWLITEENKKDVEKEALSYLPQSTASDICLSAAADLRVMLRGKAFLRLLIHDAITAECHRDVADEVAETMRQVMMAKGAEFTDYVPFPVDISMGSTWGDL